MAHLLHIDASPHGEPSISRTLTAAFVTLWQAQHPEDTITYRDLGYDQPVFVTESRTAVAFTTSKERTAALTEAMQVSDELVDEFLAADRYVLGISMHNFGVPAAFKTYIDQILQVKRSFSYDADGYRGLGTHRKALVITARDGSSPLDTPPHFYNQQEPYLQLAFNFIGVTDIAFIHADSLAIGAEARNQVSAKAQTAIQAALAHW
ncbi:MAG: FMN-dependent NADH-azoreductase [Leptolyngbya sp. BL-A-14]